jgi:hypothetical protein
MVSMNKKKCFKCGEDKELTSFYKHTQMADGHVNKCKECNKNDVRSNYREKKDKYKAYDKHRQTHSKTRIFNHRYTQMKQRVEGRATRSYKVEGRELLSYDKYSKWLVAQMDDFDKLYDKWRDSGFERKLTPSIDRIINDGGYTADNMQWITQSMNSSKH